MKKVFLYCSAIAALAAMQSCKNASYEKTKSGIMYKIISDKKGETVKIGQFIKLHYQQKLKDSVMYNSFNSVPTYARVDSIGADYNPLEVFPFLRKGDSVVIIQMADTIAKKVGGMPPIMKKGDQLFLTMRVVDVFADEAAVEADRKKEMDAFQVKEGKVIEKYLADKKIKAQPAGNGGVFVEVTSEGTGLVADSGKAVSVMYTGTLMDGGKEFDSNRDTTKNPGGTPLTFTIGQGQMIPGFEQGVTGMKKGTKAKLFIPSALGYGQRPMPGGKGFDNLVFDIEVVDVKPAPAAAAGQTPPPPPPSH